MIFQLFSQLYGIFLCTSVHKRLVISKTKLWFHTLIKTVIYINWYIHTSTLSLNLQGGYVKTETMCHWINEVVPSKQKLQSIINNADVETECREACGDRCTNSWLWRLWQFNQWLSFLCPWASRDVLFGGCTNIHQI